MSSAHGPAFDQSFLHPLILFETDFSLTLYLKKRSTLNAK